MHTSQGLPIPMGAQITGSGVNFAVFSRNATGMALSIYEHADSSIPQFEVQLDPSLNRTGDVWHIHVEGLGHGSLYLWRASGPFLPLLGHRFNQHKSLLDPYAKALTDSNNLDITKALAYVPTDWGKDLSFSITDNAGSMPKCIVVSDEFDWEGDRPLNYPLRHCVIYEAHVRGFTQHPSSGVRRPGTFLGLTEKIPYLQSLGVTSIELLPVQEFNSHDTTRENPSTGEKLHNYWGYSPIAFFAPKASYSSSGTAGEQVVEFKQMVKEFHRAGIEVILDIVFNHSAEGNEFGPTLNFRGFDNSIYYILTEDKRSYANYSGCGNTFNCNHPVVRTLIRNCLQYWTVQMHVDGFRFDLGSILGRDQKGNLLENPPIIEGIAEDPLLRNTKLIAEAWDAGGAYQVGWFPGGRWAEWNDRYRDGLRKFWRGDKGAVRDLATRITGSSDLYLRDGRKPFHSINFITSHDGFTLADLVAYEKKHNESNGENNRDGGDENYSKNYGEEGDTAIASIQTVRLRQQKNLLATLLISIGTPMILGGDECGRSQGGNNNAYCQDNDTSWFDWRQCEKNGELVDFVRKLIAFRKRHPALRRPEFFTGRGARFNATPDIVWFDDRGLTPDWLKLEGRIAARIDGTKAESSADKDDNDFYWLINATDSAIVFKVVKAPAHRNWCCAMDTSLEHPHEFPEQGNERMLNPQTEYVVHPRSTALLISKE